MKYMYGDHQINSKNSIFISIEQTLLITNVNVAILKVHIMHCPNLYPTNNFQHRKNDIVSHYFFLICEIFIVDTDQMARFPLCYRTVPGWDWRNGSIVSCFSDFAPNVVNGFASVNKENPLSSRKTMFGRKIYEGLFWDGLSALFFCQSA